MPRQVHTIAVYWHDDSSETGNQIYAVRVTSFLAVLHTLRVRVETTRWYGRNAVGRGIQCADISYDRQTATRRGRYLLPVEVQDSTLR